MSSNNKYKHDISGLADRLESEDFVILEESSHSFESLSKNKKLFNRMVSEGKIKGGFEDSYWMLYTGTKWDGVNFELDEDLYQGHLGKLYNISSSTMAQMMRNYAMYCYGIFIASSIASKILTIKRFLEHYGDGDYIVQPNEIIAIHDFLIFISTPLNEVLRVESSIEVLPASDSGVRKLRPVINYLVLENEIKKLYSGDIDDETFKKWFPIFFWTEITFILPLRATEMLVTPYKCIERRANSVYLTIRRTRLKKGRRKVKYDVNEDYKLFQYRLPDNEVIRTIEKYIDITKDHNRRFLFEFNPSNMTNEMVSLSAFNRLLEEFVRERMIGNSDYDYIRYATGIDEFEAVTAGDSRPIAMVNLYFSNLGADICMQLADHDDIRTSEGYFTNIDEIIMASSIVRMQNKYNSEKQEKRLKMKSYKPVTTIYGCSSSKRINDEYNLEDCKLNGHLDECIGCSLYNPSNEELERYEQKVKRELDDGSEKMIKIMNGILKAKDSEYTVEELYYSIQTEAIRYREVSDIIAEKGLEEWEESKRTQKTF